MTLCFSSPPAGTPLIEAAGETHTVPVNHQPLGQDQRGAAGHPQADIDAFWESQAMLHPASAGSLNPWAWA